MRVPGKRGLLPQRPVGDRYALKYLHEYADLPGPVYPIDVTGGITQWGMLGNGPDPSLTVNGGKPVGDCTFAGRQHLRMAKAAAAGTIHSEVWETTDELVTEYLAYDQGQDQGANIADLLLAWFHAGKILAFAPVDHTSPERCDSAMQAFHGLYAGVSLTDDADQLFGTGDPWTLANGEQPDPEDGHCIVKLKSDGRTLDGWGTWGAEQPSTLGWTAACLGEAWALVTTEDEAGKLGAGYQLLLSDIRALDGTV
jgi:hypothetical protein